MRVVSEYLASQIWVKSESAGAQKSDPIHSQYSDAEVGFPSSSHPQPQYWEDIDRSEGFHIIMLRPRPRLPGEFTCKYEISLCKTRDSSGMRNRAGEMSRTWRHLNIFILFSILLLEKRK